MVKNTTGGNHHKGMARKMVNAEKAKHILQLSEDELELYAQVTKPYGNNMCEVLCQDGVKRVCHIRGKFLGRNRRANNAAAGAWVLVGLREWASVPVATTSATASLSSKKEKEEKKEQCDLLNVYTDEEKDKLRAANPRVNWRLFVEGADAAAAAKKASAIQQPQRQVNMSAYDGGIGDIAFMDDDAYELEQQMAAASATKENVIRIDDDEIIDVDDI